MVLFVLYNENGFRSEIINVGKYCGPSIDHRNLIPCHCAFRTTQVFLLVCLQTFRFLMATEIRPLNSSFLSGSLCDDSRSLFEQWKKQLEFQYDFVKV